MIRVPSIALALAASVLAVSAAAAGPGEKSEPVPDDTTGQVSIILKPDTSTFSLEDVTRGRVGFTATIRNRGHERVVIGHPSVCVPADFGPGKSASREDWHGVSEILFTIDRPDHDRVVLREGMFAFFEPDNVDRLEIEPGADATFHVGWFFPNARGRWENDQVSWEVFRQPGEYKVSILYRNRFPRAWTRDRTSGKVSMVDVWQGEFESNVVTFVVTPD